MNQYQRVIVIVAAANLLLMLLFPPFQETSILRGAALGFDSFSSLLSGGPRRIHQGLLTIEIIFALVNALAGWLVMQDSGRDPARPVQYAQGLVIFGAVNLGLVLTFPPFEQYSAFIRIEIPRFDGFYFLFGDKMHRHFFIPMLYLESILIAVNLLVLYLLFNVVRRSLPRTDEHLLELAHALPAEKLAELSHELENEVRSRESDQPQKHPDRRQFQDPAYAGPERRLGGDRRQRPRGGLA